jgi:thiol-disulfide isomerase/thioredoxin
LNPGEWNTMSCADLARTMGMLLVAIAPLALPPTAPGQAASQDKEGAPAARADESVQAIDDDYNRQVLRLDKHRLERLARLAEQQKPAEAAATYERLFRLAIAGDLFRDAEAAAVTVLAQGTPSPTTNGLAHLVKIIAEADRGAFEQSLLSLRQAVAESMQEKPATEARAVLAPDEVIGICEAYYQRLVEGNQFPIATEAFRLVLGQAYSPGVKEFLAGRLKRIELVGKPAPPIQGTDLDGKEFNLAGEKGKVVLVVFWASWCLSNATQIAWLEQVQNAYHNRGLQVVGINLDVQQDGGQKLETVLPQIRRFLIDYNVPWPTLVNGSGDRDYASAYGVADIPANVLIGRDGKVAQIDLSRRNLETVVSRLLGK